MDFVNWYLHGMHTAEMNPTVLAFSKELGFNSLEKQSLNIVIFPC